MHERYLSLSLAIFLFLQLPAYGQLNVLVEIYLLEHIDENRNYCIDIPGYKYRAKVEEKLHAHTCYSYQGKIGIDQGFQKQKLKNDTFYMPEFEVCMSANKINKGSFLTLAQCNKKDNQVFKMGLDNKIKPKNNSHYCITISQGNPRKGRGGNPVHFIRDLYLDKCKKNLSKFQSWGVR